MYTVQQKRKFKVKQHNKYKYNNVFLYTNKMIPVNLLHNNLCEFENPHQQIEKVIL